jgi:L-fucose mutarotase
MLKQRLIHPDILEALASAGHGSKVLIADGNYPAGTRMGDNAVTVYLNLIPGVVNAIQTLEAVASAIPIEAAEVMTPGSGAEPGIFAEFRRVLGPDIELETLGRYEFYDAAESTDTCLQIVTAEQRLYANLLLTIGVVEAR